MKAIARLPKKIEKALEQLKNNLSNAELNQPNVQKQPSHAQILILGSESAGKRNLMTKYDNPQSDFDSFHPQNTSIYKPITDSNNKTIPLSISSVSGTENFENIRHTYYAGTTAIMLCFALNDKNKFEDIQNKWAPEIRHCAPNIPIILVGTKCDLERDTTKQDNTTEPTKHVDTTKQYNPTDLIKYCKEYGITISAYDECSAKTGEGIENIFRKAIRTTGINIPVLNIPMVTQEIAKAYTNGAALGFSETKSTPTDLVGLITPRLNIEDGINLSMVNKATYILANKSAPSFREKEIERQQTAQLDNAKSK
jgi:Ras family protein A